MSGPHELSRRELLRLGSGGLVLGALGGASLLAGCRAGRDPLDSGPYLQRVTERGAVVAAVTRAPERYVVRWGRVGGPLERAAEEAAPSTFHRLELPSLEPGTEYRYSLERAGGRVLGASSFRTACAPGTPFTFAVVGDTGGTDRSRGWPIDELDGWQQEVRGVTVDENQQGRVAAAIAARGPELVLHTGDVVYPDGALEDYPEAFFRPFAGLAASVPVVPAIGNHDTKTGGGAPFASVFATAGEGPLSDGRARSFDWGDCHVVVLDVVGSSFDPGSPQLAWLEEDLGATDRRWRIAVFHVPPIQATRPGDYESVMSTVVPALQRGRVDLALSGHDHVYARYFPLGNLTCVTTGGGGKNLYSVRQDPRLAYGESVYHFVEVQVSPTRLVLTAIDSTGRPFDTTRIEKA